MNDTELRFAQLKEEIVGLEIELKHLEVRLARRLAALEQKTGF